MIIYPQTFPFRPHSVSGSEVGIGTLYPSKTGVKITHDIFWSTERLFLTGSISASGPEGGVGINVSNAGEIRAPSPQSLILNPVGATVQAGGGSPGPPEVTGSISFTFSAESASFTNDLREQYLSMVCSGSIGTTSTPSEGADFNAGFSSVGNSHTSARVGYCRFTFDLRKPAIEIPLFSSNVPGGIFITADVSVSRVTFAR